MKTRQQQKGFVIPTLSSVMKDVKQKTFAQHLPKDFKGKAILTVVPKLNGVYWHRVVSPLEHIAANNPDEYHIFQVPSLEAFLYEYPDALQYISLIYVSRGFAMFTSHKQLKRTISKSGVPIVVDNDDYWDVGSTHVMHKVWKHQKTHDGTFVDSWKAAIEVADEVVVTNEQLASKCRLLNSNVTVIRNAIDNSLPYAVLNKTNSARSFPVFGYLGSVTHERDIRPLRGALNMLYNQNETKERFAVLLGGDVRDKHKDVIEKFGRDTIGNEAFSKYITIFSDRNEYRENFGTMPYMDARAYLQFYNHVNISLIPLEVNNFNQYKSELKLIEASAMGCLSIVSDVMPYSPFINDDLFIRVKRDKDWHKVMKDVVVNFQSYVPMIERSYNWFLQNYTMDVVNVERKKLIDRLMQ